MKPLLIVGAGGHASVVVDTAITGGRKVAGFAHEDPAKLGQRIMGLEVLVCGLDDALAWALAHDGELVVAIGNNVLRARIGEEIVAAGVPLATLVHRTAVVASSAAVGHGTVVFAGAIVQPRTVVGAHCIINTAATVDHDGVLSDGVHLSPGVHMGGTVEVGTLTHVGVGASISNNVSIGARTVVGAGSVVVRDLPDDVVAYGVPARVHRTR